MKQYLSFTFLLIFLCSCVDSKKENQKEKVNFNENIIKLSNLQIKNASLMMLPLQTKNISGTLRLNGKIDVPPQNIISVSIPLGGYLKYTKLLPGMPIKKGETIAIVEDQQYIQLQQDYLTAKSKLPFLEKEHIRQKELNQTRASSDKSFQMAESEYNAQKILINGLDQKLKLIGINVANLNENNISKSVHLFSPIDGFVSKVNVNIGKYVSPTEVLLELVNPSDIHLNLTVFEKDVNNLFIGQKLVAYTNTNPGKKFNCEILLIGKNLSNEGTTDVHCHFENYDKLLIPGTYMNTEIQLNNKISTVLPEDAVVRYDNNYFVFVQRESNIFEMIKIHTGVNEGGVIEVVLPENEIKNRFVTKGAYTLLMALKNKSE